MGLHRHSDFQVTQNRCHGRPFDLLMLCPTRGQSTPWPAHPSPRLVCNEFVLFLWPSSLCPLLSLSLRRWPSLSSFFILVASSPPPASVCLTTSSVWSLVGSDEWSGSRWWNELLPAFAYKSTSHFPHFGGSPFHSTFDSRPHHTHITSHNLIFIPHLCHFPTHFSSTIFHQKKIIVYPICWQRKATFSSPKFYTILRLKVVPFLVLPLTLFTCLWNFCLFLLNFHCN
jgi:hypothetical protein